MKYFVIYSYATKRPQKIQKTIRKILRGKRSKQLLRRKRRSLLQNINREALMPQEVESLPLLRRRRPTVTHKVRKNQFSNIAGSSKRPQRSLLNRK